VGKIVAFCIVKIPRYRIIRDILERVSIKPLSRGDIVELLDNLYIKVLWPPSNLDNHEVIAKKLEQKISEVYEIVEKKAKEEKIEVEVDQSDRENYGVSCFSKRWRYKKCDKG
jgi:hypothetical protein